MKKLLFIFIILISSLNASYLLGHLERCADDYYYKSNKLYYLKSDTGNWNSTATNVGFISDNYIYDSSNNTCRPDVKFLGLTTTQYNFIYALLGLIFGSIFFWLVPSSKK